MCIIGHMAQRRDKVREAYESMGIDRHELANRIGLTASTITNVMAGAPLSRVKAALIGQVIGWTADEVLVGERTLERKDDDDQESDDVSPGPLPPSRPSGPTRPPNRPNARLGVA